MRELIHFFEFLVILIGTAVAIFAASVCCIMVLGFIWILKLAKDE